MGGRGESGVGVRYDPLGISPRIIKGISLKLFRLLDQCSMKRLSKIVIIKKNWQLEMLFFVWLIFWQMLVFLGLFWHFFMQFGITFDGKTLYSPENWLKDVSKHKNTFFKKNQGCSSYRKKDTNKQLKWGRTWPLPIRNRVNRVIIGK